MGRFKELCGARRGRLIIIAVLIGMMHPLNVTAAEEPGHTPPAAEPGAGRAAMATVSKQVFRLLVRSGNTLKTASGFLVSGRRIIATNHHVIDGGTAFVAGYVDANGNIKRAGLRLLASFQQKDLALLEASEDLPGSALPLARDYPEFASDVFAIGYPSAADLMVEVDGLNTNDSTYFAPSVVRGSISRVVTASGVPHQIQHQTPISSGYSGGPLVGADGVVVGVSSAIHKVASGLSYAVSSVDLTRLLVACSLPARDSYVSLASVNPASHDSAPQPAIVTVPSKPQEPASAEDANMLRRAYQLFGQGNIASARRLFEFLVEKKQLPDAYIGLARSYDPDWLTAITKGGSFADRSKAAEYYRMDQRRPTSANLNGGCDKSKCSQIQGAGGNSVVTCQASE